MRTNADASASSCVRRREEIDSSSRFRSRSTEPPREILVVVSNEIDTLAVDSMRYGFDRSMNDVASVHIDRSISGASSAGSRSWLGRSREHDVGAQAAEQLSDGRPRFCPPAVVAMVMLLQHHDDKILLLPAWPADWDVSFKLHAPGQTTVECVFRNGKIQQLKVTPESRRKDLVIDPAYQ